MPKEKPNEEQLHKIRHSLSHLLAAVVLKKYPEAILAIGPAIDNGFYYDFDLPEGQKISEDDLKDLEKSMKKIAKQNIEFKMFEADGAEAKKHIKGPYKEELLNDLKGQKISFYQSGDFIDLCAGPHVASTKEINPDSFKLNKTAGAYWRGDEKNKMLTRIYGLAFASKEELDSYLKMLKEAEARDHRKLNKDLELYVLSDLVGQGLPLFTPKGTIVRNEIIKHINELQSGIGFLEVHTPQMNKAELFKTSGHYDKYKDDMFIVKSHYSDEEYFLKPMNCPQHTQIYASQKRSYRDLPLRYADFANLFRDEKPGEVSGLTRLKCFSQDDGHSFCREDQIEKEFQNVYGIIKKALEVYELPFYIRLSLRDEAHKEKYLGDDATWQNAQKQLEDMLIRNKINYVKAEGEAAFYAPKMDIIVKDAIGREWQICTIQIDYHMPRRFNLTYTDHDGKEKNPIMIHRAIIGSPDRFMGILLEHYAGNLPLWLSPVQIKIISVGSAHFDFCRKLSEKFKQENLRIELDLDNETVGNKIRKASKQKIPYLLVIGDKEMDSDKLAVKVRGQEKIRETDYHDFIENVKKLIFERKNEL
jgi:threonyl-tRNA synthetase